MPSSLATWSLLFFVIALALFAIEVFVPSGGLLGVFAIVAAIGGIICLFQINTTLGLFASIVCVAAIPVLIMGALKFWPHTPFGRMLIIKDPKNPDDDNQASDTQEVPNELDAEPASNLHLLDMTGIAHTDLRPVGVCRIDDRKEPCMSVAGMIKAGTPIKVVAIHNDTIKVQAVED